MKQSQKNCLDFSTLIQRVTGTGSMKLGMAFLFCGKVFYFRGDNIENSKLFGELALANAIKFGIINNINFRRHF